MAATGALVHMPADCGGAASLDGNKHLQVQPGEPGRRPIQESVACCAYKIGQLQEWPRHLFAGFVPRVLGRREHERVERACGGFEMPLRQVQIPAGGFQIGVAQ
jgi:hypothetical protein